MVTVDYAALPKWLSVSEIRGRCRGNIYFCLYSGYLARGAVCGDNRSIEYWSQGTMNGCSIVSFVARESGRWRWCTRAKMEEEQRETSTKEKLHSKLPHIFRILNCEPTDF